MHVCRRASPPRPTLMVGDRAACQAAYARLQVLCEALQQRHAGVHMLMLAIAMVLHAQGVTVCFFSTTCTVMQRKLTISCCLHSISRSSPLPF